jgi:hypothetical protein
VVDLEERQEFRERNKVIARDVKKAWHNERGDGPALDLIQKVIPKWAFHCAWVEFVG